MDAAALLRQIVAVQSHAERQALLQRHAPLDTAVFVSFKDQIRVLAEENSREALRAADACLEASEFAATSEGPAYAWWARGNALLLLGRYDDCMADYSTAVSILADLARREEIAQIQSNWMLPLMWTGRHAEAQAMGTSALKVLAGQGDTPQRANLLHNVGICSSYQGDHVRAMAEVSQARDIFVRLGNALQAARCQVTLSVVLEGLDRFDDAEHALREALQVFFQHGAWVPWARTALNLGILNARLAHYQVALRWLDESRSTFLRAGVDVDAAVADLYRGQCLLDVNLLVETAALGESLIQTFTQLKMPRQIARAASLLADVHQRQGQLQLASRELDRARQVFLAQQDVVEVALLDLQRAALLLHSGQAGAALRLASEASQVLDVSHYPLRYAEAHLLMAACCQELGRIEEAQIAYQVAWAAGSHPTGTTQPPPALAYQISHARGAIAEASGDPALARGEYGRAINALEQITHGLGLDELRGGYLADKRAAYEAAMRLALQEGRIDEAFRYSELARAGALRACLAGRPSHTSRVDDGNDAELQALKARWAWRISHLRHPVDLRAEADAEPIRWGDQSAQLRELAELERQLGDAYRRRRLADPRLGVLEMGDVLTDSEVGGHIPPDAALLSFEHVADQLLAFVITPDGLTVSQLGSLGQSRWDAAALGHALEEIHLFDDLHDLAVLEADVRTDLQALYHALLADPLTHVGPQATRLFVVPCDALHTIPFEALHDGGQYVLDRFEVSYLPSASLLPSLPRGRDIGTNAPLVMACSWEGRLPWALDEGLQVGQALRANLCHCPIVLTEEEATTSALVEHAPKAGLVHLAVHGSFRSGAPLFSSLQLADGPLTVNDVYTLDLGHSSLVTLSGCQTGLGQGQGGEMLGLAHAFFQAGASTLVVSRWQIADESTARLMHGFYQALASGQTIAGVLREAQLAEAARRPHPGFWAGFAAWGRGFDPITRRQT